MEPDGIGALLGAIMGAISGMGEGSEPQEIGIADTPSEYRPLELSVAGHALELGPRSLNEVSLQAEPMPALLLSFRTQTTAALASMTASAIGQPMIVSVCGAVVMQPIIQEAILTGSVQITGSGLTLGQLDQIARQISGEQRCPEDAVPVQGEK